MCLPLPISSGNPDLSGYSMEIALGLTTHWVGYASLVVFFAAYLLVVLEERIHLRKSIPVMIGAGVIWALVGIGFTLEGDVLTAAEALRHNLGEFAELFLFILSAMTFVSTMEERQLFHALRAWIVRKGWSFQRLFWATGVLAFFLSSQIDNLTAALVVGAVSVTLGRGNAKFTSLACINVVVAANAGGAWSAFGDITTLMVWQAGRVEFFDFYRIFVPSVVNWLIPAFLMSIVVPKAKPGELAEHVIVRRGAWAVVGLFAVTIVMTVSSYNLLSLPPVIGMTTGLGLLKLYGYYLQKTAVPGAPEHIGHAAARPLSGFAEPEHDSFDVFEILQRAEWDTLMFFFGIIASVGGLATLGYLEGLSAFLYGDVGATVANISVGIISAMVDNIPVMFAVLNMNPEMDQTQWLLVTLTAGTGGSLLSVGSAAGVALMGQARGEYTFFSHLRWTWAIALGYAASVWVHLLIN